MTEAEIRSGLRRLRWGTPAEHASRLLPAIAVLPFFLLRPELDLLDEVMVALLSVVLVASEAATLLKDRSDGRASAEVVRVRYWDLLEKARKGLRLNPVFIALIAGCLVLLAGQQVVYSLAGGWRGPDRTFYLICAVQCALLLSMAFQRYRVLPRLEAEAKALVDEGL